MGCWAHQKIVQTELVSGTLHPGLQRAALVQEESSIDVVE
jgi:hypothetical protein